MILTPLIFPLIIEFSVYSKYQTTNFRTEIIMNEREIAVKMVLNCWANAVSGVNNVLSTLSDEEMESAVSPGRNNANWIVGHLAAVNDFTLSKVLGAGEMLNPRLADYFTGDAKATPLPAKASEIR